MGSPTDDDALDALAAALAPRVLEKVRALLAVEQDDDHALGVAVLASIGYVPAKCPSSSRSPTERDSGRLGTKDARRRRKEGG